MIIKSIKENNLISFMKVNSLKNILYKKKNHFKDRKIT